VAVEYYPYTDQNGNVVGYFGSDGQLYSEIPRAASSTPVFNTDALMGMDRAAATEYILNNWNPSTFAPQDDEFLNAFYSGAGGAQTANGLVMTPSPAGTGYNVQVGRAYDMPGDQGMYGSWGLQVDANGNPIGDPYFTQQERSGGWLAENPGSTFLLPLGAAALGSFAGLGAGAGATGAEAGAAAGANAAADAAAGAAGGAKTATASFWSNPLGSISSGLSNTLGTLPGMSTQVLGVPLSNVASNSLLNGTLNKLLGGDFTTGALIGAGGTFTSPILSEALGLAKPTATALAPFVTGIAVNAAQGGSFEDYARSMGISLLLNPSRWNAMKTVWDATTGTLAELGPNAFSGDNAATASGAGAAMDAIFGDGTVGDQAGWPGAYEDMWQPDMDPITSNIYDWDTTGTGSPGAIPWTPTVVKQPVTQNPGWIGEGDTVNPGDPGYVSNITPSPEDGGWDDAIDYPGNGFDDAVDYFGGNDPVTGVPNGGNGGTAHPTDTAQDPIVTDYLDDAPYIPNAGGSGNIGPGSNPPVGNNTPLGTGSGLGSMLGLGLLALALSQMKGKSPTTEYVNYAMPQQGPPKLPTNYTVGWQPPSYSR